MKITRHRAPATASIACAGFVALLLAAVPAAAQGSGWTGSWACSQQIPEPQNALPAASLTDTTLREIVHLSLGGRSLRVHVSNAFGNASLELRAAHIALAASPNSSGLVDGSDHALTFAGQGTVSIPPGAEYLSDPVVLPALAGGNLAISLYVKGVPSQQTGHPGSRATSYLAPGDQTAASRLTGQTTFDHWAWLSGVDVATTASAYAIVALGDSITDGHGATLNGNDRWPDVLAERLLSRNLGVLNQGIGGNHLLTDGLGPNVLARFDRDVLAQTGVRTVLLLEGINDLGALSREGDVPAARHQALVHAMEGAYQQIVARAHAQHIRVVAATILPFYGSDYYHPTAQNEQDRVAVNAWIRTPGHFDAVVDWSHTMEDPSQPGHLLPAYDSGDHLHPSPAGYRIMGESIPMHLFAR